ncbi:addiction module protein [bacterium]|nr:addiction module protein [bacterium]
MSDSEEQRLRQIFENAKALSPIDRADLLERIFGTFDSTGQSEIDQKWAQESEERLGAYRSGLLDAEPVEQVLKRIDSSTDS